jgi:hypothetical protein
LLLLLWLLLRLLFWLLRLLLPLTPFQLLLLLLGRQQLVLLLLLLLLLAISATYTDAPHPPWCCTRGLCLTGKSPTAAANCSVGRPAYAATAVCNNAVAIRRAAAAGGCGFCIWIELLILKGIDEVTKPALTPVEQTISISDILCCRGHLDSFIMTKPDSARGLLATPAAAAAVPAAPAAAAPAAHAVAVCGLACCT